MGGNDSGMTDQEREEFRCTILSLAQRDHRTQVRFDELMAYGKPLAEVLDDIVLARELLDHLRLEANLG